MLAVVTTIVMVGVTSVTVFAAHGAAAGECVNWRAGREHRAEFRHRSNRVGERPTFTEGRMAERQTRMEERLTQALEDGQITQKEFNAFINGEFRGRGNRRFRFDLENERQMFFERQLTERRLQERLTQALADGLITQEQFDAFQSGKFCIYGENIRFRRFRLRE